jgi:hypothetical protein
MAFQFRSVELSMRNESGEPVTSAILNPVDWTPAPKATKKKPTGKNQTILLETHKRLAASGPVKFEEWRKTCIAEGTPKERFNEAKRSLVDSGMIEINHNIVTVCERTS